VSRLAAAGLLLVGSHLLAAGVTVDPKLPSYEAGTPVSGELVVAGNHATDEVVKAWANKFARYHPQVRVQLRNDTRLTTDAFDVAIASGAIDIVPSARE